MKELHLRVDKENVASSASRANYRIQLCDFDTLLSQMTAHNNIVLCVTALKSPTIYIR